jgi:hypothetical protein
MLTESWLRSAPSDASRNARFYPLAISYSAELAWEKC